MKGAATNNRDYIQESETIVSTNTLRHGEYRLQAKEYKKMSHSILNNDINNKKKKILE